MKKVIAMLLCALMLTAALAGCGGTKDNVLVINDGQFSEMWILHRMAKLLVEDKTDLKVEIKDQMSPTNAYNEMLKGNGDIYNSYDGTLLTTFLHLDPADVPDGMSLYDYANQQGAEKGVRLLDKLGLNNTYILAVPQAVADEYNLETVSDLVAVADQLVFGAEHEFFTEDGSAKYNPLVAFYGLKFKEAKQIDLSLKYSAIKSGNIDVTVVYATDGMNREANLKGLTDDQGFFPEYNGALMVPTDLFERFKDTAPNLEETLNLLGGLFTDEDMVGLSYAVDIGGRTPEDVAEEYLKAKGLLG